MFCRHTQGKKKQGQVREPRESFAYWKVKLFFILDFTIGYKIFQQMFILMYDLLYQQQLLTLQFIFMFSFSAKLTCSFNRSGLESTNCRCWKYGLCHEESFKKILFQYPVETGAKVTQVVEKSDHCTRQSPDHVPVREGVSYLRGYTLTLSQDCMNKSFQSWN